MISLANRTFTTVAILATLVTQKVFGLPSQPRLVAAIGVSSYRLY